MGDGARAAAVLAAAFLTWKEMENDDDDDREFTRFEREEIPEITAPDSENEAKSMMFERWELQDGSGFTPYLASTAPRVCIN